MSSVSQEFTRVVSGMRPTGSLHLGHYHGVLKNWIKLQHEYQCFFFVADLHALTTHYEQTEVLEQSVWDVIIDWLSVGINPGACKIFIQSKVPEHCELFTLLSMMTPQSWLERVPTYKDQQEKLKDRDLATYGFLGYPLLQSADILAYKAGLVPVGEDQLSHLELTREVARRFNHLYGKDKGFQFKVDEAIEKMGKKNAKAYLNCLKSYQESGDDAALETGHALVSSQANLSLGDRERLYGHLEGSGKIILPEPQALLTPVSKMPGLDSQKMSKSYNNTIGLREAPEAITLKMKKMPTDPARVRRQDPGTPEKCPVWEWHKIYSSADAQQWVQTGCTTAGIGCLECKQVVLDKVLEENKVFRQQAEEYINNPSLVKEIVREGCEAAKNIAGQTLEEVKTAMGIKF